VYIVDHENAGQKLQDGLRLDARGRKSTFNARLFLIGGLLCVQHKRNAVLADIYRILTQEIDREWQVKLGIRDTPWGKPTFSAQAIERFSARLSERLEYGLGSAPPSPEMDDTERERRRVVIAQVLQAMLDATLVPRSFSAHALDTSAFWAWGRAKRTPPKDLLARDAKIRELGVDESELNDETPPDPADTTPPAEDPPAGTATRAAVPGHDRPDGPAAEGAPAAITGDDATKTEEERPYEPDGQWSVKTTKDGGRESVFGFDLHALVNAPDLDEDPDLEPVLVSRFDITPAGQDIVATSLRLIDASIAAGVSVKELLADRHYSYKLPERWAIPLTERGIEQVVALHKNDLGFRDYNGAKLAAGWLHCPRTPDFLGDIPQLGPNATPEQIKEFNNLINQRRAYAFRRVTVKGRYRFECPGHAGTVGCDRVPGSVDIAIVGNLPVITAPPDDATAPKWCTQDTVELRPDGQRKIWQKEYWGSPRWIKSFNRRTYVEGAFGNIKNPSTENLCRGFFRVTGLAKVTLLVGLALVAHNARQLRNWHERTGNGDENHPLLQPDSETLLLHVSPAEYAAFQAWRALQQSLDDVDEDEEAA
jgi:hypothetical protein